VAEETTGVESQEQKTDDAGITQDRLNELIDQSFGKGYAKAEGKLKEQLAERDAKLTEISKELETIKAKAKKGDDKKGDDDTPLTERPEFVQALDERMAPYAEEQGRLKDALDGLNRRAERLAHRAAKGEVIREAAGVGFIDPEDAWLRVQTAVEVDPETGAVLVKDQNGRTPVDAKGEPLTVKGLIENLGAEKPHLLKAAIRGGAGTERQTTATGDAASGNAGGEKTANWALAQVTEAERREAYTKLSAAEQAKFRESSRQAMRTW